MKKNKIIVIILIILVIMLIGCKNVGATHKEVKVALNEEQLLLNGVSLTDDIIKSVYRGENSYTYEVLLYALAVNDNDSNLYKDYFSYNKDNNTFIFSINKVNQVLIEVFGEKQYFFENVFDYEKETGTYFKCLDFGWNTAYIAENMTSSISDDKSKLYVRFDLVDLWHDVGGNPEATTIAECEITYNIIINSERIYLQFDKIQNI